eukprot:jgi/Tetstr1/423125/TSEL_013894.t1
MTRRPPIGSPKLRQRQAAVVVRLAAAVVGTCLCCYAGGEREARSLPLSQPLCYAARADASAPVRGVIHSGGRRCRALADDSQELLPYPVCREACPLRFEPEGCALLPTDAASLLQLLSSRRLVLWGDSIMRGLFDYLSQVLLRSQPRTVTSLQAKRLRFRTGRGTCPPAVVVDGVRRPQCLRFPRHAMELCFVQAFRGVMEPGVAGCMAALTPRDVVLFNSGLHFGHTEADTYRASVAELTKVLARLSTARGGRSRMPFAIWRETSAQHFPGGGEFRRKAAVSASFRCQQAPLTALRDSNWRNAMAETALGGQLPILRVWNVSAAAPQAHTHVRVKAAHGGLRLADCSHFCGGPDSMYAIWAQLLANQLGVLLPSRQRPVAPSRRAIRARRKVRKGQEVSDL